MTVLSEALSPNDALQVGTASVSNYSFWTATIRPASSTVLVHWHELSDETREILSRIRTFSQLKENWDSYGAEPPSKIALQNAFSFVKTIDRHPLPVFFAAPGPNGEILVESKEGDKSIEITFEANGNASYAKFEGIACIEEGALTDQVLPDLAAWLHS